MTSPTPTPPQRQTVANRRLSGERPIPLRLHAVTLSNGAEAASAFREGARLVVLRDLGAVVTEAPRFDIEGPSAEATTRHRGIVDSVFRQHVVLPAPVGVVFRSEEILRRWLELHYVALSDGIEYLQDRRAARVHVCRTEGCSDDAMSSDATEVAAESFRALRRSAAASVPLRLEHLTGIVLSAAFLVDAELWEGFTTIAKEQQTAHPGLKIVLSGPWAPYDFVHMQFGA